MYNNSNNNNNKMSLCDDERSYAICVYLRGRRFRRTGSMQSSKASDSKSSGAQIASRSRSS